MDSRPLHKGMNYADKYKMKMTHALPQASSAWTARLQHNQMNQIAFN